MSQASACEICGYRPRVGDRHEVLDVGLDQFDVVYVRCYDCGNEWVE